jgi:hypothetical protein
VCAGLNGYIWTDYDIYQSVLWHPFYGDVWNLDLDAPLTHGGSGRNCRCWLSIRTFIVWSEIKEISDLGLALEVPVGEIDECDDVSQIEALRSKISELRTEISGVNIEYTQIREMETGLHRTLLLLNRVVGDKIVKEAIRTLSHLISVLRVGMFTLHAFQAAAGPVGWFFAITGVAMTISIAAASAVRASDSMMMIGE